jgi:hypothetical protein
MAIMEAVTLESELMATLRGSRSDAGADADVAAAASVEPGAGVDEKSEGGTTDDRVLRRRPNMGK